MIPEPLPNLNSRKIVTGFGSKVEYFHNGSIEKIAFFDASDLYALNLQQEVLNCIIFIFSDL